MHAGWCGSPDEGVIGCMEDGGRQGRNCYKRLKTAWEIKPPFPSEAEASAWPLLCFCAAVYRDPAFFTTFL